MSEILKKLSEIERKPMFVTNKKLLNDDDVRWLVTTVKLLAGENTKLKNTVKAEQACFSLLENSVENFFSTDEQMEIFRKYHDERAKEEV